MESLIKLKPVNVTSDVKEIRTVLDSVEIQVRGLHSLGIDSAQYGALLIPIFMEKLPDELRLIVSRKHKDDWELNAVLGAVKSEFEARERSVIQPTIKKCLQGGQHFTPEATTQLRAPYCMERANLSVCFAEETIGRRNALL